MILNLQRKKTCNYSAISKIEQRQAVTLIHSPHVPPSGSRATHLSVTISVWDACFHQLPTCLHHIYISQLLQVKGGGIVWHQLPPFNTCAHSHQDHIPLSSWRKYTHLPCSQIPAMFSGNIALCFREPPLRRPGLPPTRAKMLQIIEAANTEVFLLTHDRYCQDVNGRQSCVTQKGLWGFQRCISSGWIGRVTSAMCWHRALLNIH